MLPRASRCSTSTGGTASSKPQGIAELNEGGLLLSRAVAEEIAAVVDDVLTGEEGPTHA